MSLVSCAIGKQLWNLRASDLECQYADIGELLNDKMNDIRDLANRMSFWDQRISELQGLVGQGQSLSNAVLLQAVSQLSANGTLPANGITPNQGTNAIGAALNPNSPSRGVSQLVQQLRNLFSGPWSGITGFLGNIRAYQVHLQHARSEKARLEAEKRKYHEEEKILQSKKDMLDTQLKLAKAMGPAFEKMENDAVKRFAPKV